MREREEKGAEEQMEKRCGRVGQREVYDKESVVREAKGREKCGLKMGFVS